MRIASSTVSLSAEARTERSESQSARVLAWVGDPPPAAGAQGDGARRVEGRAAASAAQRARALAQASEAKAAATRAPDPAGGGSAGSGAASSDASKDLSPREELNLLLLLRAFGLRPRARPGDVIRKAYEDGAKAAAASELPAAQASGAASAREGWGLEVDARTTVAEHTVVRFAAAASVTTADGRTIETAAALELERLSVTTAELHLRAGDPRVTDPLAVNLTGAPVAFDGTEQLDLDSDGTAETIGKLAPGSAWLARDLDGSGRVETGAELFGPTTGSGFAELAALDGDGNGWIDEGDAGFGQLALWNGDTLTSLAAAGIGALHTGSAATPLAVGADGAPAGVVRATGIYLREDGTAGTVQHVDLVT